MKSCSTCALWVLGRNQHASHKASRHARGRDSGRPHVGLSGNNGNNEKRNVLSRSDAKRIGPSAKQHHGTGNGIWQRADNRRDILTPELYASGAGASRDSQRACHSTTKDVSGEEGRASTGPDWRPAWY